MVNALMPQSATNVHRPLSLLQKPLNISQHGSSLRLQPIGPRRSVALRGNWPKECSIRASISNETNNYEIKRSDFPPDFIFGTATSAYQYEGAVRKGGKGRSNWDEFTHRNPDKIKDGTNADIAVDSYHRYEEHVALMKDLGVNACRLSIAWSRILPNGKLSGGVNEEGIKYYNDLINEILSKGIQPFVVLFNWDLPQALEDEYGSFLNSKIIEDFKDYVNICFENFGDRVKHWITLTQPIFYTIGGYVSGSYPPGSTSDRGTDPYKVVHNLLLSHATAVDLYKKNYQNTQNGQIGLTMDCEHMVPLSEEQADIEAAKRASDFTLGWFVSPLTFGDYPKSMKDLVGERLPKFSTAESQLLKGSFDFLGLNYYTAKYVTDIPPSSTPSYTTDGCYRRLARIDGVPIGPATGSDWLYIYPQGMKDILLYIKENYNDPIIYIAENGISEHSFTTMDESLKDDQRVQSIKDHLSYLKSAMDAGVKVKGYFVWTLLDTFEWNVGHTVRFGINYVDFNNDLAIYPKESAKWFKEFLLSTNNSE
ncbi:beta-glucosidase 13-like [Macadamia integrifolia]|uniref:beta-glucosidase 13-like n=1 Tax=Macadamia integrifolia TaxID=60698 RepID=UPI001C4E9DAC|nr:beta-glucosidase 13-like [Macadamia integrifolia]